MKQKKNVTEADILYAVSKGAYMTITLQNGRTLSVLSTLENLYSQLIKYPMIFPISKKVLVNARHLDNIKSMYAYMCDGNKFRISLGYLKYAKHAQRSFL
ncbi:MAG: LytTR family transcriptional regulator DNA-binding domain-containing protein [Erysipelotrichales bacterium]|nr:LytTR family transcriptional regulator DNA-binding domain-containing protein [Erysipelotrichales bacterium]